jgi:hypothetical protein
LDDVFSRVSGTELKGGYIVVAQFLAVCSSSILAETLGYSASFSSPLHGKRCVFEEHKLLLIEQLQPSTNADKLSELFYSLAA